MGHDCTDPAVLLKASLSYILGHTAQPSLFCSLYQFLRSVLLKKLKIKTVQFQELRSSEPDRFCLNGFSQIGDEERILTTSSLKSILFNKYEV